jgi:hypothetical protein
MIRRKTTMGQTITYKTIHKELKIRQHEPTKYRGELRSSGRATNSCFYSDIRRLTFAMHIFVISHERGTDRILITTNGTCWCSFITPIFRNGQPRHGGDQYNFQSDE